MKIGVSAFGVSSFNRLRFCFALLAFALVMTAQGMTAAQAGVGCNNTVQQAANDAGAMRQAADAASSDQTNGQPPSTLMQTCQNQSAGTSATQTGNIFSGDFMAQAQPIVGSALNSLYSDFGSALNDLFGAAIGAAVGPAILGAIGGLFGGAGNPTQLENNYACDGIQSTWQAVAGQGIQTGVVYPLLSELLTGAVAGAGPKFNQSIQASGAKNIFTRAQTSYQALPRPNVPTFNNVRTLCDALIAAGVTTAGSPGCP